MFSNKLFTQQGMMLFLLVFVFDTICEYYNELLYIYTGVYTTNKVLKLGILNLDYAIVIDVIFTVFLISFYLYLTSRLWT